MRAIAAGVVLLAGAAQVEAGGIDRTGQSIAVLYEAGRYVELSFAAVSPSVSGTENPLLGGQSSGDMSPSYVHFGAAYKADVNDRVSYALILEQPFGADVDYPVGTGYFAQGSMAEFDSLALTGLLQYNFPNNVSVHAGLRLQAIEASAAVPFVANYQVTGARDFGLGYVAGVAYERPDIALRISLTYNSEIEHELDTVESGPAPLDSTTRIDTPESLNLDFQTGIAPDTLLFGGVRWVDWSDFNIRPAVYAAATGGASLVSYADDVTTYSLGIGRRINDTWSVSASVAYEENTGSLVSNLGPTNGLTALTLAAIYTHDNMRVTTGVRFVDVGDADTRGPVLPSGIFTGNDAVALGVRVGWSF